MNVVELNMDGLVGPSHHYAGLAVGNLASMTHALTVSNPAAAAHQGIDKMRLLHKMGLKQAVLPPHQRPNLELLYDLGFPGMPAEQIIRAGRVSPQLLSTSYSASSMWAANTATITPSLDAEDNKVHFTAANLVSHLHRHQEAHFSHNLLKHLFANEQYFYHHPPIPSAWTTADEGAANHTRFAHHHHTPGIHLYVYGRTRLKAPETIRFMPRQALEASESIARSHGLDPNRVVFAEQHPKSIDLGVFHNDVIATGNESLFLIHEDAFMNQSNVLSELTQKADFPLQIITIKNDQLSLKEAVDSYFFNAQLVTLPNQRMALIAPIECETHFGINAFIHTLINDPNNPIDQVHYLNLKQSMNNGGGPACLRLRVLLNDRELAAMHPGVLIHDALLDQLDRWVDKHYRTELTVNDLCDPQFINECFSALDELTWLLKLGSIYPFQREKGR